ncbi:hypothetical protein SAMN05421675_0202 [Pasteurella multocida]|uniref:DUF5420 family protein n=1 Tax=Pasteurella multocida TaxID=747 RepID=UPI0008E05A87|nr:DUF5420 family protein [Pasteurella multocida]MDY0642758.1 DUF5420 family protein [Pasteurella multocida]MEE3748080.1 DUF5420 family protein [Pasteurella multocida]SFO72683.1 hypothetical protein SAMN05421675_0202 [Pasteurella multocida]VEE38064.1 Uncharacterised protein [Pasteurella multocida subsp. gallicida]HDR0998465.1 DUF5420 family protein [Pasteurella multocida]
MKPQKRYFKCLIDIEPIKSLNEQWFNDRKKRNNELKAIFDTIPFYECWHGDENSIYGIVYNRNNPEFEKIKDDNSYKIEKITNERVKITGNGRTKQGKELNAKIKKIRSILQKYPSFNNFILNELNLHCWVLGGRVGYRAVCGVVDNHFLVSIPVKTEEFGGDEFPNIPDFLTEIKHSEFLAIQGE